MNNSTLMGYILRGLRKEDLFEKMVTSGHSGENFTAADVVLTERDGNAEVYRISVIKHNGESNERTE